MVAFEISVNGQRLYTIGAGDFGLIAADLMWHRIQTQAGPIHEMVRICGRGLEGTEGNCLNWPAATLKVGDEVTIRITQSATCDEPSERITREALRAKAQELSLPMEPPPASQ